MVARPLPVRFNIPDGEASAELVVKNSLFVGTVGPARDEAAARALVARTRVQYPDANHHAWAYIITGGPQAEIGSSDDGEPGGTAGRPMLAVLEGHGLVQAVAVGTRYFGGTKLGTGGLVRAYSECIRHALERLPTAEMVYYHRASICVDYALYATVKYALPRQGVIVNHETFAETVCLVLSIPPDGLDATARFLSDATSGRVCLITQLDGGHYVKTAP